MFDNNHRPQSGEVADVNTDAGLRWPLLIALAGGVLAALLTISLEYPILPKSGTAGAIVVTILFPGMLVSLAIAGNVHDFNLWIATGINCIFYFLTLWLFCTLSRWILRKII